MFRRKKTDSVAISELIQGTLVEKPKQSFSLQDLLLSVTLGTGTFGRVRLVKHNATEQYYALKILKKSEIIRLKQFDHIKSEIQILSKVSHPFIVNMVGHFQDDMRLYMVLEYVQGGELFSYLRRQGRLSDEASKFYIAQLILAMAHLHSMNIVYRDLKPENVLITNNGYLKVTDFGFAKIVEDRTWTLCGTPEYLAPEIVQSKGHGKSVDWWALGVLLYEMLAGYPPFYDENPFGIYQKILAGRVNYPRQIDSKAKDLIKRLLTSDRTKRLGCLKNGAEDVVKHKYFSKYEWSALLSEQLTSPFVPKIAGPGDHQHFDPYPDSPVDNACVLTGEDKEAFGVFDTF